MDSLNKDLPSMSNDERERLIAAIGLEPRSIRRVNGDVVDALFSIDEALSIDEGRSRMSDSTDPIHYSQLKHEPMAKIQWSTHLESIDKFLGSTGGTLLTVTTSIFTCAESMLLRLSSERFANGEVSEYAKKAIHELVRLGREMLDVIEDYDNYKSELSELCGHIGGHFAKRPLVHGEPLRLVQLAFKEVQWRLWLVNSPLRQAFDELDVDPTSFEAAFRAYACATLLPPWIGATVLSESDTPLERDQPT